MHRRIFFYSVIASVMASVVFSWLLDPVTKWVWNYAATSASSWLIDLQNAAFSNASLGKRDWVSAAVFMYGSAFGFGGLIGLLTGTCLIYLFRERVTQVAREDSRRRRFLKLLIVVLSILLLLLSYKWARFYYLVHADLQLNASFSQRVDALAPYIESIEERRLRSAWALMTSREDYDRINQQMEKLARRANIKLPKLLYK